MTSTRHGPPVPGHSHEDAWDEGFLSVSSIHRIHYEQYGKKDGKPVLVLHGGPGGKTSKKDTEFFDPAVYRVILHDQRGAGRSTPAAELRENTSQLLVSDIEALREHLGVSKWHMVFGGSWGSTLSLLYAETHPQRVASLVVRGIYTVRKSELGFMKGSTGAAHIYPAEYADFLNYLPEEKRADPYPAYYELLTSEDYDTRLSASKPWNRWELSTSALELDPSTLDNLNDHQWSLQHARIEAHYEINGGFMEEGHLLKPENIAKIKDIPCEIVQGRYDLVCPARTAWDLHKALPNSTLYMIPDAGHTVKELGIRRKLLEIADKYASL